MQALKVKAFFIDLTDFDVDIHILDIYFLPDVCTVETCKMSKHILRLSVDTSKYCYSSVYLYIYLFISFIYLSLLLFI